VVAGSRRGVRWRREAYLTTLTEWAEISRGAFAPLGRSWSAGTAKRGRQTSSSWLAGGAIA
jgi:hypothetical protein